MILPVVRTASRNNQPVGKRMMDEESPVKRKAIYSGYKWKAILTLSAPDSEHRTLCRG